MQHKAITIRDVAHAAGCSVATASRVLNNSGPVSSGARERVESAARHLGFSFNAIGRALQSRRTKTIGCLVPSLANPVFAEAVQGAQEVVGAAGYQLLLVASNYDQVRDNDLINTLVASNVDGVIATMIKPADSIALRQLRARGIPLTLMFHDPQEGFCSSYVDNAEAAREVARQFARIGHRNTGFIALRFSTSDRSQARYAGFLAECRALGLPEPLLLELSESDARNPERLVSILQNNRNLSAVFVSNDLLAIAVQKAARLLGWRVPQDLSIAGFDGIDIGLLLDQPLATIETLPEAMGRQAARLLLEAISGAEVVQPPPLPFRFRAGATLAPPARKTATTAKAVTRPSSVHPAQVPAQTRTNR